MKISHWQTGFPFDWDTPYNPSSDIRDVLIYRTLKEHTTVIFNNQPSINQDDRILDSLFFIIESFSLYLHFVFFLIFIYN